MREWCRAVSATPHARRTSAFHQQESRVRDPRSYMCFDNMGVLLLTIALLMSFVNSENVTLSEHSDTCEDEIQGPWSQALEDWATSAIPQSDRHGRVMVLAPSMGYYVTERIDSPLLSPPPPPPALPRVPPGYSEWEAPGGKIINRPSKDKFKPSYPAPNPMSNQYPNSIDRVGEVPKKQVSETDLYLLSAIEKLVYRADIMEKRLRKVEESLHLLVATTEKRPDPCASNFTRVGDKCYWISEEKSDWKDASKACRARRAAMVELPSREHTRALLATLLADSALAGDDYWTGGLNPGLLWIWSHSARPVQDNSTSAPVTISGSGRCLALAHEPAARAYMLRGADCAMPLRYICQLLEDQLQISNEIQKTARMLILDRHSKEPNLRARGDRQNTTSLNVF